ncbi:glycosyl transferase family protein [Roseivivax marinus]|uniref:Glycosyl transferase family protein n=1 Tax=Roseivivax marinus TaxID=1379903 RepID=W4HF25_9RHOB|nr:glycosyltransferase family A protein [Roseivivax marinus]ETW10988.1 glycosyl transferase family protein [Roseivivax marinus]
MRGPALLWHHLRPAGRQGPEPEALAALCEAEPARGRAATDAALRRLRHLPPAERADQLAERLSRPDTRGQLRVVFHLLAHPTASARQAGRRMMSERAFHWRDFRRAEAEAEAFLAEPHARSAAATDAVLARLTRTKLRLGKRGEALELNLRRAGDVPTPAQLIERAWILQRDDPDAARDLLARCGAQEGGAGRIGSGLVLADFFARGDLAGVERLASRIEDQPECTLLARAYRANAALSRGDPSGQRAVFAQLGLDIAPASRFDALAPRARHPVPDADAAIDVVMTAYNAADHIETAIRAVLGQSWRDLTLIVVDDGSRDGTPERVAALAASDERLRLMRTERNGGTYLAKNLGIRAGAAPFVALCDADDMWMPDHAALHLAEMLRHPEVMVTTSHWIRMFGTGGIDIKPQGAVTEVCPHSTFFRRAAFDRVGYFDSVRIGADREILGRIALEYGPSGLRDIPKVLTLGRRHGASLTTSGTGAAVAGETPAIRHQYWHIWNEWHLAQVRAGRPLYNSGRPEERPYPVPDGLI